MAPTVQYARAMFAALAAVAILAALSSPHCAVMCGPLASCARANSPKRLRRYHLGRLVGYAALGVVAGSIGSLLSRDLMPWLAAIVAWLAAAILLLAAIRAWRLQSRTKLFAIGKGPRPSPSRFAKLIGSSIGKYPGTAGSITALLPCGVLWAAVAIALTTGSLVSGAVVMAVFAVLSGISIGVAGLILNLLRQRFGSRPLAIVLALSAVAFVILPLPALTSADAPADDASCPLHAGIVP